MHSSWKFDELRKSINTVLIPIGSTEVEGPHLPMGLDSIVALEVAKRISEVSEVMVAPLISLTYSDWHMGFPGTLTVKIDTLTRVLRELCRSLIEHGLNKIIFINAHVGNDPSILDVGVELLRNSSARVANVNLWSMVNEMAKNIPELNEKKFLHAGEIMTSLVMAIRPDLVDMEKAKKEYVKSKIEAFTQKGSFGIEYKGLTTRIFHISNEVCKWGVMGDPSAASAEKGELIMQKWIDYFKDYIIEFQKLPVEPIAT